jgi:hypothetical protein
VKVVADGALLGVVDVDEVVTLLAGADGAG